MYIYYNPNPRGRWWAGDCVIRAIACAEGADDWDKVYWDLSHYGNIIGDWGNNNAIWDAYLRDHGYTRHICPNDCPLCFSISDFAREHPNGTYIAATGRHAVAVIDGDYFDSFDSGAEVPIYYYTKER
jgi:hypothetical protein